MLEAFQTYWHADQDEPRFLIQHNDPEQASRRRLAAAGAVAWHCLLLVVALSLPDSRGTLFFEAPQVLVEPRRIIPLVAPRNLPPFQLTQKEPQQGKPASEVDISALLPRPEVRQPQQTPPGKPFVPPPGIGQPAPKSSPVIEAPKIEVAQQAMPNLPAGPALRLPGAPPPDAPKLTNPFERVGGPQPSSTPGAQPKLAPPKQGVDEAIRALARSGAPGRGLVVGDTGAAGSGGISEAISQDPSPRRNASTLELLSDPKGVDFRPYLIQVLAAVKRNWMAVTPESVRFGLQGRTAIQFSISKSGSVPKLVIAMPSGREALDRAAVAGISASNPFPPLPAEFTGSEIRLQLVFSYNMPRQ
jgi:TonB family protein